MVFSLRTLPLPSSQIQCSVKPLIFYKAFIAYQCATYIRDVTVSYESAYAVAPENQEIVCWGTQYIILWP